MKEMPFYLSPEDGMSVSQAEGGVIPASQVYLSLGGHVERVPLPLRDSVCSSVK